MTHKPTPTPADITRNNNATILKMIKALANKHVPLKK